MKHSLLILLLCGFAAMASAQRDNYDLYKAMRDQMPGGTAARIYDSLYQLSLPELTLPENLKNAVLPAVVDNSLLPYLRPVINQGMVPFCEQAASVGYNFTYEMDFARNLPADTSINQYPLSFPFNFDNDGYGGVSFFYSLEIIRKCGIMNVSDYGGLSDNGTRWITGYDLYYKGMHNRIQDVYTIKTNTAKGILTLKNWVYNHLGESDRGGVANFQAGSPWNAKKLPVGTPEAGKYVIKAFPVPAGHGMTIVGYNDSIRYDYNNDGQFTNNLDINSDGIVDVRDWEIGGFKFVNSYGENDLDSGFCYMMYRTLAEDYNHGGIWNNTVTVLKVKPDYTPLLTMKLRIKDNQRNSIRLRAGVSNNPQSHIPEHSIDFPIFNYQGGNNPMQGPGSSDSLNTIEFGLDITPLLSYIQTNSEAAFFLEVDEYDPYSQSTGSIEYFSVIDYSSSTTHFVEFQETPLEISNNSATFARVVLTSQAEKVKINNTSLPAFTAGEPYTMQMTASGGQPPYSWSLLYDYTKLQSNQPKPVFEGTRLVAQYPSDSVVAVALGFSFPFYGREYDTVYVNIDNGYLQFTADKIPWPDLTDLGLLLQSYRIIAPLTNKNVKANKADDGTWYETEPGSARFRWNLSRRIGETYFIYLFQVHLTEHGTITFNHDSISVTDYDSFYSGISDGDKQNYQLSSYKTNLSANRFNQDIFVPTRYPGDLKIDQNGLVECIPASGDLIYTIPVMVSDYRNVSDRKSLLLSTGILADIQIHAGSDSIISNGEEVFADLVLTNLTSGTYPLLNAVFRNTETFISLSDTSETINNLEPNSKVVVQDAFRFNVADFTPDGQEFLMDITIESNIQQWNRRIPAKIHAPLLKSIELQSTKPGNELLRPGEIGWLKYKLANIGHATAKNTTVSIQFTSTGVVLLSPGTQSLGNINAGQRAEFSFQVKASDSMALGTRIPVLITLYSENQTFLTDTMYFRIGKAPVLVIDYDIKHESGPVIYQQILDLGYNAEYSTFLTDNLMEFQSVFLNTGKFSARHVISYSEAAALSEYLNRGGNLYLESSNFWRGDPVTSLHPMFALTAEAKFHKYETLAGMPGTFTDGLSFLNQGYQLSSFHLKPYGSAFSVFQDEAYICSVANNAMIYKTIGNIFDFKSMQGTNEVSTQEELMKRYLDFFGIKKNSIGIDEHPQNMQAGEVKVYPNPATDKVLLSFERIENSAAKVTIFDLNGTEVADLDKNTSSLDRSNLIEWNLCNKSGQKVLPGLYFCRITAANEVKIGKILVQ